MDVPNIVSVNLTASVSDHLLQFLAAPSIFYTYNYLIIPHVPRSTNMKKTGQFLTKTCLHQI